MASHSQHPQLITPDLVDTSQLVLPATAERTLTTSEDLLAAWQRWSAEFAAGDCDYAALETIPQTNHFRVHFFAPGKTGSIQGCQHESCFQVELDELEGAILSAAVDDYWRTTLHTSTAQFISIGEYVHHDSQPADTGIGEVVLVDRISFEEMLVSLPQSRVALAGLIAADSNGPIIDVAG